MKRRSWPLLGILALSIILTVGCGTAAESGAAEPAEESMLFEITPELVAFGEETYRANCAPCHGPGGKGDGPSAATLDPPPRDHTNAEYMDNLPDKKIADTIKMGGAISGYPNMPSNPHLKGDQIVALVAFVRRLSAPDAEDIDLSGFMMPR